MTHNMPEYFSSPNPRVTPIIVASAYAANKCGPKNWDDSERGQGARSVEPLCMIALALGISLDAAQLRDWTIRTFGEPYVDGFTRAMQDPGTLALSVPSGQFSERLLQGLEDGQKINQALALISGVINALEQMDPIAERLLNGDAEAVDPFVSMLVSATPLLEALEALDSGQLH